MEFDKFTIKQLSSIAATVGAKLGFNDRLLMRYRPYICPFHILLKYIPEKSNILDIGCGMGLWLFIMSRSGLLTKGTGIDINAAQIEKAKMMAMPQDVLDFRHISIGEPWPRGDFDCITIIDVLHHIPKDSQGDFWEKVAKTSTRRIIFKDIDPTDKVRRCGNTLHDLILSGQIPEYYKPDEVEKRFCEMNYRIVDKNKINMLWYSHYWIVAEKQD